MGVTRADMMRNSKIRDTLQVKSIIKQKRNSQDGGITCIECWNQDLLKKYGRSKKKRQKGADQKRVRDDETRRTLKRKGRETHRAELNSQHYTLKNITDSG